MGDQRKDKPDHGSGNDRGRDFSLPSRNSESSKPRQENDDRSLERPYRHSATSNSRSRRNQDTHTTNNRNANKSPSPRHRRDNDSSPPRSSYKKERRSTDQGREENIRDRSHKSRMRSRSPNVPSNGSSSLNRSPKRVQTSSGRSAQETRERTESSYQNRGQQPASTDQDGSNSEDGEDLPKEKPNFGLTGLLTAETNTFNGVVIKYNEPPEALKPNIRWRWYVFKGKDQIDMLHLHRQSAYLIGRDRKVADIPVDHPSISKQHAVLQYRKILEKDPEGGQPKAFVRPYLIDLDTTNGTFVNGNKIPPSRYFELKSSDVLKFACSTREYVFLREE